MNVLICDDDQYVRKMLKKILSQNKLVNQLHTAGDGLEAVKMIGNHSIDLALLDIDMPHLDGLEAAKLMKQTAPNMELIFITGYMEYAMDSFCVHPYDYILKPVDIERLEEVIKEIHDMFEKRKLKKKNEIKKYRVQKGAEIALIPFEDILYFEKSEREVLIHTSDEIYSVTKNLVKVENELPDDDVFVRTHKSFIVNMNNVKKIEVVGNRSFQITFDKSDKEAILSRHKYDEVVKYLDNSLIS